MTQAILASGFNGVQFDIIDRNNQPWLRANQIGLALGYKDPAKKIHELFTRHAEEFTESMTQVIEIPDTPTLGGQLTIKVRIFSLRGCHLLAMFARTTVAKAFRVWVLDILERLNLENKPALPAPAPSTADDRAPLRALVHAWSQISGSPHQALWPQVKAHFQLSRIDDLPVDWIPDALNFVQGKIDACRKVEVKALPAPTRNYTLEQLEELYEHVDTKNSEMWRWAQETRKMFSAATGPVLIEAMHKLTNGNRTSYGSTVVSLDPIFDMYHGEVHQALKSIDGAFSDLFLAIRVAKVYARAIKL